MRILNILIIISLLISLPITHSNSENSEDQEIYKYIIICPSTFEHNFKNLIKYKSNYITSKIITIEDIVSNKDFWVNGTYGDATNNSNGNPWIIDDLEVYQNFSLFNDTQAKIRNFIRFAYDIWETEYVLLGGDHEHLPSRRFYCYVSNWTNTVKIKPIQSAIISDHYFSALNGSWNNDCDLRFGEEKADSIAEEADFKSEIFIGRAPVNDKNDVNIFVHKVISYETTEKPKGVQLHQSYIQPSKIPDTTHVVENCAKWIPEHYQIERLYEQNEKVTKDQWINTFHNNEKFLFYQVGNGYNDELFSWYQLSWDGAQREIFSVLDVGELHNSFYPIHISISCQTSDFSENECLAEELLLTQRGGASACIGNTEVGCLNITDATKYSSEFFERIFYELFENETKNLARILQNAKEFFINRIFSENQYRWCFYELVLLGDPETPSLETRENINNDFKTFFVDDDYIFNQPGWNITHFSSIQSAIDKIDEFSTIIINPGTYIEHIIINKTLLIHGSDMNTTIITNKDNKKPILTLQCHSTTISNITIKNGLRSQNDYPESLLYIKEDCNGNHIENSKVTGKAAFGILLRDSIRNCIKNNVIEEAICGIGIINTMIGLLPTKVIVTCDNIVSNNLIQSNQNCGLYIEGSIHNYIKQNVFLNNGKENDNIDSIFEENNICLIRTKLNIIDGNYWNKPYEQPYQIWSLHGPITIFTVDISKGLLFKYYKCILILNLGIPFPVYDQNPALEI